MLPPLETLEGPEVVVGHRQDVLAALAEWGQGQADHIQAEEEILAEPARSDLLLEGAIGGRDQPHVGLALLGLAQALVGSIVQEPEQAGLGVHAEVADLVEEEGPPFGLLDLADGVGHGPREGAPAMAEQDAAHQIGGEHGAVDRDERPVRTPAVSAYPAGEHGLAGAALAAQQNDRLRGGRPRRGLEERGIAGLRVSNRPSPSVSSSRSLSSVSWRLRTLAVTTRRAAARTCSGVNGFGQVVHRPQFHRFDRRLERGEGGDDDDAHPRLAPQHLRQQHQPGVRLEPQIQEDDVEAAAVERLQRTGSGADAEDPRTIRLEAEPERLADSRIVVDDEGGPGGGHGLGRRQEFE